MANPQCDKKYLKVANEIIDALCRTRIPGEARQLLDTIIRHTYGFNRKEVPLSLKFLSDKTGMRKNAIIRAEKRLVEMNMIVVLKKENEFTKTYAFQKDYEKWNPQEKRKNTVLKKENVLQKENDRSQKREQTFSKKRTPTITKDNLKTTLKDNSDGVPSETIQTPIIPAEPKTDQARFVERFGHLYEMRTGQPFKADQKHYVLAAKLIKKYGYETVAKKAILLAEYCKRAEAWFAKGGWADFTIEKLSGQWNSIIPAKSFLSKDEQDVIERERIRKQVEEQRAEGDRIIREYKENANRRRTGTAVRAPGPQRDQPEAGDHGGRAGEDGPSVGSNS